MRAIKSAEPQVTALPRPQKKGFIYLTDCQERAGTNHKNDAAPLFWRNSLFEENPGQEHRDDCQRRAAYRCQWGTKAYRTDIKANETTGVEDTLGAQNRPPPARVRPKQGLL